MENVFDTQELDGDDLSIYSSNARESMLEDDGLSALEEGFMSGYEKDWDDVSVYAEDSREESLVDSEESSGYDSEMFMNNYEEDFT